MSVGVIVALISAVVALASALISVYAQFGLARYQTKKQAEATLAKYREPLIYAAHELQSRFYNIHQQRFLQKYYLSNDDLEKEYALESTLYVIAQYFSWTEILRRDVQFLNLGEVEATRNLAQQQERIGILFHSDAPHLGSLLRLFRAEQRAIGECMITSQGDTASCRGYASFVEDKSENLRRWFVRLGQDVDAMARAPAKSVRLVQLQHALVDLIDFLDPDHMRFSKGKREKIPALDYH
jgi:hypothetical protein